MSTNGLLALFILPPYSSHLNPDELGWVHVKNRMSKKVVQTKENMIEFATHCRVGAYEKITRVGKVILS